MRNWGQPPISKVLNPNKPLQQLKTLRSKYFIIPAQLGSGARRSVFRLAVRDRKLRAKLHYLLERTTALPCNLNSIAVKTQGCSLKA